MHNNAHIQDTMVHPPLLNYCYLAGPLENVSREEATDWRKSVELQLRSKGGIYSFIPGYDSTLNDERTITRLDFLMIDNSEVVLVNLSYLGDDTVGTGTMIEVGYAFKAGKMIVGYTNKEWKKENRFLKGCLDQLFKSEQEAIDYLIGFNVRRQFLKHKL